jgi:hypothetical protein
MQFVERAGLRLWSEIYKSPPKSSNLPVAAKIDAIRTSS